MANNLEKIDIEKEMKKIPDRLRWTIELEALGYHPDEPYKTEETRAVEKVFNQYLGLQISGGIYF